MIEAGLCVSYKAEILRGVHRESDLYRIALYAEDAPLSPRTASYAPLGEVGGPGYQPGGRDLSGFAVTLDGGTAVLDFADPSWPVSTLVAHGALIYNATRENRAVAVVDFGADIVSTNGPFTVRMPTPAAGAGLIRIV